VPKLRISSLTSTTLATIALGLVVSSSASAVGQQWVIEHHRFEGQETIRIFAEAASLPVKLKTSAAGASLTISCGFVTSQGAKIFGIEFASMTNLTFEDCKLDSPVGCEIAKKLVTQPLLSEATSPIGGAPAYITFAGKESSEIIKLTVSKCAAEGTYTLKNRSGCRLWQPTSEQVIKLCNFEELPFVNSLRFGVSTAVLQGTIGFLLTGTRQGTPWAITPVPAA
jgi:hypothetical protein